MHAFVASHHHIVPQSRDFAHGAVGYGAHSPAAVHSSPGVLIVVPSPTFLHEGAAVPLAQKPATGARSVA